jgi:hypothetical protein
MLITNFGDLKAVLSKYMFHSRQAADYDLMVSNFEKAINRVMRVRQMEAVTNLTTVAGVCDLPADYLLWRAVIWGTDPDNELDYVHPVYLGKTAPSKRLFTVEGSQFKTNPIDDATDRYLFHYYQKIPSITGQAAGDSATNWLLTEHPDAYEYGCVFELAAIGRNADMAQGYKARRDEVIAEIVRLSSLTTGATSSAVRQTAEYF